MAVRWQTNRTALVELDKTSSCGKVKARTFPTEEPMRSQFIDFSELKAKVSIKAILSRYGFLEKLHVKGKGKLVGACPIHKGKSLSSFHVDTKRNIFNCFSSCGGGNILDLVMKIEECQIRDAGLKLSEWFNVQYAQKPRTGIKEKSLKARVGESAAEAVNPPLKHELKTLKYDHPYLRERGLLTETVSYFGVGYCSRGIMEKRIAIPIHNEHGELVAYAGRAVDDELIKKEGKYKLPDGFKKSHVVWNLNRAREHSGVGLLIVVEGYFDAMHVHQAGFPNVVALMGSTLSQEQELLLIGAGDRLALMFDGDEAGLNCMRQFWKRVRRKMYLKEIALEKRRAARRAHASEN